MSEQQTKHLAACASRLVQFDADSGEAVNCGLPCDCENPARWVTVPVGEPTPPATPQPETPLADVPHEEVDELVATIYAERRALSPPPDVERLKAYKRGFRDGFAAAQSWGCDMVEEALAAWSPSTPGEPT